MGFARKEWRAQYGQWSWNVRRSDCVNPYRGSVSLVGGPRFNRLDGHTSVMNWLRKLWALLPQRDVVINATIERQIITPHYTICRELRENFYSDEDSSQLEEIRQWKREGYNFAMVMQQYWYDDVKKRRVSEIKFGLAYPFHQNIEGTITRVKVPIPHVRGYWNRT